VKEGRELHALGEGDGRHKAAAVELEHVDVLPDVVGDRPVQGHD